MVVGEEHISIPLSSVEIINPRRTYGIAMIGRRLHALGEGYGLIFPTTVDYMGIGHPIHDQNKRRVSFHLRGRRTVT